MLTKVDIFGVNSSLSLTMGSTTDLIQITDIEGLGPVKAGITSQALGYGSGEAILGASIGKRNLVFHFKLNPDWDFNTVEELRKQLYALFMPPMPVTMQFTSTHLPLVQISGFAEDLPPDIFSKDSDIVISVICGDPDFVAVDPTTYAGTVFASGGIDVIDSHLQNVPYEGNMPTGINVKISENVGNPTFSDSLFVHFHIGDTLAELKAYGKWFGVGPMTIDATHHFELNSVSGAKRVNTFDPATLTVLTNLLGAISPGYTWPILMPGMNRFGVQATTADSGQDWALSYYARFGGM